MSARNFTIPVSELDAGGKEYRFAVEAAWVRGALEEHEATSSGEDGRLVVRASTSGRDVVVHGTLDVELSVPCARCLEPTRVPIHSDLSVLYVRASEASHGRHAGEHELTDEEASTLPFDGETVVLDDLVRDELILETPMIPLCSEACPGISPASDQASGAKPIDPRLSPLFELSARLEPKSKP